MRSPIRDEYFKSAARRLHPGLVFMDWPTIERPADGGAFVEVRVFVPEDEAKKDETAAKEAKKQ